MKLYLSGFRCASFTKINLVNSGAISTKLMSNKSEECLGCQSPIIIICNIQDILVLLVRHIHKGSTVYQYVTVRCLLLHCISKQYSDTQEVCKACCFLHFFITHPDLDGGASSSTQPVAVWTKCHGIEYISST